MYTVHLSLNESAPAKIPNNLRKLDSHFYGNNKTGWGLK